jgi:hypothetical protein
MTDELKQEIRDAFSHGSYPGDSRLRDSNEGFEPDLLEAEFKGKTDWRELDAKFIDQAPDGFGSALSFFSHEAFRFYLPAYLIADVDGLLEQSDPVFHLCHGLDNASKSEAINPLRYGNQTWHDYATERFAMFSEMHAAAIANYLRFKRDAGGEPEATIIGQALLNYWDRRSQGAGPPT